MIMNILHFFILVKLSNFSGNLLTFYGIKKSTNLRIHVKIYYKLTKCVLFTSKSVFSFAKLVPNFSSQMIEILDSGGVVSVNLQCKK